MPDGLRSNSGSPSACSTSSTARVMADCALNKVFAARLTLPVSATRCTACRLARLSRSDESMGFRVRGAVFDA
jgi:hypothetical protein